MRIFTLLAICIFVSSNLLAQQKGDYLLGGTLGFTDYKTKNFGFEDNQKNFYFNPSIGMFYANNRMAGVNLSYLRGKYRDSLTRTNVGAGVFLRQFKPLGKSFLLFAEEGIDFSRGKYNETYGAPAKFKTTETNVGLNFYPGIAYLVNKRLWLEVALPQLVTVNYTKRRFENKEIPEPDNETSTDYFSIDTGLRDWTIGSLSFSVRWLIGKK